MPLRASPLIVWSLGLISLVLLAFEVFLTRLLAYALDAALVYVVLGVAMLGFGAAGSLVSLRQSWLEPSRLPRSLAWAALTTVLCFALSVAGFVRITDSLSTWHSALLGAALLAVPFLAGGTVVTLVLSSAADSVGKAYAANLIGSALGCVVPFFALGPLTGERLLGVLVLGSYVAALGFVGLARPAARSPMALCTLLLLPLVLLVAWQAPRVFAIRPEPPPIGQVTRIAEHARAHGASMESRYDRWNPTGRIQIFLFGNVPDAPGTYPILFYAQDAGAGSFLMRWDGVPRDGTAESTGLVARNCSDTLFAQGYLKPRKKVLVIGIGGAPDVQCALWQGATQVDAVEINEDSIAAVRGPFDRWLGGVGRNPRVRYHHQDGRSFAHQARGAGYDLITLSGVDTKSTYASGALALSENALYTREAFSDYLQSLAPNGAVAILRFGSAEAIRLANTAAAALAQLGAAHPERHIAVLSLGVLHGVLVQREPFTADDTADLARHFAPDNPAFKGVRIFFYEPFGFPMRARARVEYLPGQVEAPGSLARAALALEPAELFAPKGDDVRAFFDALSSGTQREFARRYSFDISPTSDDRPFFFDIFRYDRAATWGYYHVRVLLGLLGSVLLLSVSLIVVPVWRRRASAARFNLPALGYFGGIGLGFLLIEVWLLHRFGMYLGHQSRALVIVLSGLLLATGLGAVLGERWWPAPRRRALVGCAGLALWIGLGALGLPSLHDATWSASLPLKAALTLAFVVPLGMLLGLPFPAGLAWAQREASTAVPWCIGVNAFASVLASVVIVPLSMFAGYAAVLFAGCALYAIAALCALGFERSTSATTSRA